MNQIHAHASPLAMSMDVFHVVIEYLIRQKTKSGNLSSGCAFPPVMLSYTRVNKCRMYLLFFAGYVAEAMWPQQKVA